MKSGSFYVDAPMNHIPVYQRGGTIVPTWQRVRRSSKLMIEDPYTLFVAVDSNGDAKGQVYIDDTATHDYRNKQFTKAAFEYK